MFVHNVLVVADWSISWFHVIMMYLDRYGDDLISCFKTVVFLLSIYHYLYMQSCRIFAFTIRDDQLLRFVSQTSMCPPTYDAIVFFSVKLTSNVRSLNENWYD